MPVNLSKVQKKIIKKKGKDAIHENSRDSKILRRAGGREEKLAKAASVAMRARRSYTNRVDFFKDRLPEDDSLVALSDEELLNGTIAYLSRLDDEIAHLESEQRKNRPPAKRLLDLREAKQAEARELDTGGFWVPDMTDEISVKRVKGWNGEWSALSAVKFVRMLRDGTKKGSSFPPRGMS